MRSATKLRDLLRKHTVAFSHGEDGWSITTINLKTGKRENFTGLPNFSQVVHAAHASRFKKKPNNDLNVKERDATVDHSSNEAGSIK